MATNDYGALPAYRAAAALTQALGDPDDEGRPFAFTQQLRLDEAEHFPEAAWQWLQDWRIGDYFIPSTLDEGKLASFEEALALLRVIARRDLTLAIALGQTYLGAIHIWLAGTPAQQAEVATLIRQHGIMAFALTERDHGSDILASAVSATLTPDGYCLHGEKWLINNATRAHALTVFARTKPEGGPRGFSLLLVVKQQLSPTSFQHCPKVKTHGIRGADISGIVFNNARVAEDRRIGPIGAGLEIALQGLQVTRTLCAGFSLGAADSALRTVIGFAAERQLYGESILAIPHVRQQLAGAFIDLLTVECVAVAAARGLHFVPEQFSIWSAIVKYFVPTTVERLIGDLAIVLGARYYLREGKATAVFQKIMRDHAVVSLFDGSTVVNLNVICTQLAALVADPTKISDPEQLARIFTLATPLPPFPAERLTLLNRGRDVVGQGITLAQQQVTQLPDTAPAAVVDQLQRLSAELAAQRDQLSAALQALVARRMDQGARHKDPAMITLAKHYCTLHAATACLFYWLYNRATLGAYFAEGSWLVLALDRLLGSLQPQRPPLPALYREAAITEARRQHQAGQHFSTLS